MLQHEQQFFNLTQRLDLLVNNSLIQLNKRVEQNKVYAESLDKQIRIIKENTATKIEHEELQFAQKQNEENQKL